MREEPFQTWKDGKLIKAVIAPVFNVSTQTLVHCVARATFAILWDERYPFGKCPVDKTWLQSEVQGAWNSDESAPAVIVNCSPDQSSRVSTPQTAWFFLRPSLAPSHKWLSSEFTAFPLALVAVGGDLGVWQISCNRFVKDVCGTLTPTEARISAAGAVPRSEYGGLPSQLRLLETTVPGPLLPTIMHSGCIHDKSSCNIGKENPPSRSPITRPRSYSVNCWCCLLRSIKASLTHIYFTTPNPEDKQGSLFSHGILKRTWSDCIIRITQSFNGRHLSPKFRIGFGILFSHSVIFNLRKPHWHHESEAPYSPRLLQFVNKGKRCQHELLRWTNHDSFMADLWNIYSLQTTSNFFSITSDCSGNRTC